MSETAAWISIGEPDPTDEPQSVGRPHVEVRIADEKGGDISSGQTGRILVRGDQLTAGYLDDPGRTAASIQNGWLVTGDLGSVTTDGRLVIAGREKDLIDVAGIKVYPSDVETAALRLKGVVEAAAFPIPDENTGEAVALAVVSAPEGRAEESGLRRELKKILPANSVPKKILFLDELPKNPNGKVLRKKLTEDAG